MAQAFRSISGKVINEIEPLRLAQAIDQHFVGNAAFDKANTIYKIVFKPTRKIIQRDNLMTL